MPDTPRVNQQTVAKAAGCSRSTVSLALRDHPTIPEKTRARIKAIAETVGYHPDPMLSALATYRNGRAPKSFRGTLMWLANSAQEFVWHQISHFRSYHAAAVERAAFHGYQIDLLDVGLDNLSWSRAASIMRSRGVQGILVCPQPRSETNMVEFPWQDFAAVTFGHSVTRPRLHAVAAAQYRAALTVMDAMVARGYKRIGLEIERQHDQRTDHNYLAGYLTGCALHGLPHIPPFFTEGWLREHRDDFMSWVRHHRLDGLVTCSVNFLSFLKEHSVSVPGDLGVASPLLGSGDGELTGVWEVNENLGRTAVDILVSMLHRNERGLPEQPQRVLVEGIWVEGSSLRPASVVSA